MKNEVGDVLGIERGYILQQVNCKGVMGSGIAKSIRDKWPEVYDEYKTLCHTTSQADLLGKLNITEVKPHLLVVSLFGQFSYGADPFRRYTSYDALDGALRHFNKVRNVTLDIHHPKIGAGRGNGDWDVIAAIIKRNLGETTLWLPEQ